MPIKPTYPGVYVQEIPSGVHTIVGVSTSVTAFVGLAKSGPVNQATRVLSFADYERSFGGLVSYSPMSYAVQQFFLNGGSEAWIVRVISQSAGTDSTVLNSGGTGNAVKPVLRVSSLNRGETDRTTDVFIDRGGTGSTTFTMTIVSTAKPTGKVQQSNGASKDIIVETFKDLSMKRTDPHYVVSQVNGVSQLVTVDDLVQDDTTLPAATTPNHGSLTSGTVSNITTLPKEGTSGADATPPSKSLRIALDSASPYTITPKPASGSTFADLEDAAKAITKAVKALNPGDPAYSGFGWTVKNNTIILSSGSYGKNSSVAVQKLAGDTLADDLQLSHGTTAVATNSQELTGAQAGATLIPDEEFDLFIGSRANFEGIYALDKVDLINLICLPGVTAPKILGFVAPYCEERRAFMIVDAPHGLTPNDMYTQITGTAFGSMKTDHGAIYYPWVKLPDPLDQGNIKDFPPSGTIAGLYARTDSNRGVWKAPAGTEATLQGVQGFEYLLNDNENGVLNPQGVNCLRFFPAYGFVSWGARTLLGADDATSEYKYIPVRRTALYIEESLRRGLQWVVFEPNDEPLWAQIRLNVGAFMHNLFVKGAFQGKTPRDAYFVKCDNETTTQNDIDQGIVNIVVGFAPLKPAEFVIISLQQIAGQLQV
jgi:uncharacterized protein